MKRHLILIFACGLIFPTVVFAQCGGSFSNFVHGLKEEARMRGFEQSMVDRFFARVEQDPATLQADRRQSVFQLPFTDFARRLISADRLGRGRSNAERYDAVFDRIEARYGIPRGVLLAFWAFETDYGAFQGNFNTLNSLVTLSHDCRRPELFRPQIFAALELYSQGDFDPQRTTGAWAGEIGMVQMLPGDILERGIDGDGDGHVTLKTSAPDALMSAANMLSGLGWRPNEPWLVEAFVPAQMDWSLAGLQTKRSIGEWEKLGVRPRYGTVGHDQQASLILPQGHKGPAFLAFDNFNVYFDWNQSFVYVLTAAYFGTRLSGAPVFDARAPEPGLNGDQMKVLQRVLAARGHDVGGIDGILGAGTRAAVRAEQSRLELPADAWPTQRLFSAL